MYACRKIRKNERKQDEKVLRLHYPVYERDCFFFCSFVFSYFSKGAKRK